MTDLDMFSDKTTEQREHKIKQVQREQTAKELELIASLDLAKEVEGERDIKRRLYEFEDKHQREGFSYKFRRWGDFLSIYIERNGNPPFLEEYGYWYKDKYKQKYATTINLSMVREIKLIEGHPADERGELSYSWDWKKKDGTDNSSTGVVYSNQDYYWSSLDKPGEDYILKVKPIYIDTPKYREFIIALSQPNAWGSYQKYNIKYKTKHYPRPAEDDQLVFTGIDLIILIPAGMGEEAKEILLTEIARGEKKAAIDETLK